MSFLNLYYNKEQLRTVDEVEALLRDKLARDDQALLYIGSHVLGDFPHVEGFLFIVELVPKPNALIDHAKWAHAIREIYMRKVWKMKQGDAFYDDIPGLWECLGCVPRRPVFDYETVDFDEIHKPL